MKVSIQPVPRDYRQTYPRAYVFVEGETIVDNFINRRSRPYNALRPLVRQALEDNGVRINKLSWRQTAGCGCGCSPGFIIDGTTNNDWFITVSE